MALDQSEYQHIEDLKNNEKKDAEDELYSNIESWTKNNTTKTLELTTFVDDCKVKSNEDDNDDTMFDSFPSKSRFNNVTASFKYCAPSQNVVLAFFSVLSLLNAL